ncbi:MAG: ERF family protein [Sphingopyxis sp.]
MNTPAKVEASIASAYVAAFAEIEGAVKDAKNPHFKSKYADLPAVIAAIKPALIKHGLAFTQPCEPSADGVTVRTILHHASGDFIDLGSLFVPANKRDAQGFGSALTYARRYALVSAFGVPTEDDDGNAASASMGRAEPHESQEPNRQAGRRLNGPLTSVTALEKAIKAFVVQMGTVAAMDEWYVLKNAHADLLAQAERDHPDWWNGWSGAPDGFTPLRRKIEILEASLSGEQEREAA